MNIYEHINIRGHSSKTSGQTRGGEPMWTTTDGGRGRGGGGSGIKRTSTNRKYYLGPKRQIFCATKIPSPHVHGRRDVARHGLRPPKQKYSPPKQNESHLGLGLCFLLHLSKKSNGLSYWNGWNIGWGEIARCRRNFFAQTSAEISPD